jgi:hypothetical protein
MRTPDKGPRPWVWSPCRKCGQSILYEAHRHSICARCRRRDQAGGLQ